MKQFLGQVQTKTVTFMDGDVQIKVLTVGDAKLIEAKTKALQALPEAKQDQLEILRFVIRTSVIDADQLTDEELDSFPISELTKLSENIMGVSNGGEGND